MPDPQTIDLRAVSGGDKGLDMIVADERHHRRELVLRQKCLYLQMLFAAVTALDLVYRATANEVLHNIFTYALGFRGHDAHALATVKRSGEIVDRQTVDPRTDNTDDHHAEVVDQERSTADDDTADSYRRTDIEMQVFVDDLS